MSAGDAPLVLARWAECPRGKWSAADERDFLLAKIERLRIEWMEVDDEYTDGIRATNAISASSASARLHGILLRFNEGRFE